MSSIVGAFSEEQVARLTGLSKNQLSSWNRNGFISAEYKDYNSRSYSRIYSFRDLLRLRVLNQLRNVYQVPMSELRRVSEKLAHLGDDKWTSQKLWVVNREVVFEEPESLRMRAIASGQYIAEIPLEVITSDAREDINKMNSREDVAGNIIKKRQVHSSDPVFEGTRIPVSAVIGYLDAGYKEQDILNSFPSLRSADIAAARKYSKERAA